VESKQWEFKHEQFREGEPNLLKEIARRKSKKREATDAPNTPDVEEVKIEEIKTSQLSAFNFSLLGSDDDEVEKLKGINTLLMKEVIRLQQQQETTQGAIKQILDELIESRKSQQALQSKVETLASEIKNEPKRQKESKEDVPIQHITSNNTLHTNFHGEESSLLGLDDLAHLELTGHLGQTLGDFGNHGLELNMANLLHITPPPSPVHPPSPLETPGSPYHSTFSPQIPLSPPLSPSLLLGTQYNS